jgi:hypothetical protein
MRCVADNLAGVALRPGKAQINDDAPYHLQSYDAVRANGHNDFP